MFFSAKKAANFPRGGFLSNSCAMLVFTHDTPRASDDRFEGWFGPGVVLTDFTTVAFIMSRVSKISKSPLWSKKGLPISLITLESDWTSLWKVL